ncbi:ribbon-helix-helix domain-containing protein [Baaleninema simplex]|uniref:ribbon-helix-helix domain-containing protein n=1 Tax=Baaleninema simplex TaxID=2862350 RepID=UPI000345B927|nr:type II toxin-antitoxin system ParD family antitoxin [Baaleninema simplex]
MQISLNPEQEAFIQTQLANGRYRSVEDLFTQALTLLQQQQEYDRWLSKTQQKVEAGIEALDRGEGLDGDVAIERLRDRLHQPNTQ